MFWKRLASTAASETIRSRKRRIWMDVRGTLANLINWSWKASFENNCGQNLILMTGRLEEEDTEVITRTAFSPTPASSAPRQSIRAETISSSVTVIFFAWSRARS